MIDNNDDDDDYSAESNEDSTINNDNDNENDLDNDETFGYYRHIQELGSRKIYAPMQSYGTKIFPSSSLSSLIIILFFLSCFLID